MYDISKQKEHIYAKNLLEKLWTFEYLKMDLIFKSPYHNHFLMNFNVLFIEHVCYKGILLDFYSYNIHYFINHLLISHLINDIITNAILTLSNQLF